MDERLFIDNIDMEWCFRAKAKGYRLLGVSDALLYHRLGDSVRRLPFPGIDKAVLIHSPRRQYYIMRNRLLLYRRAYVPLAWKCADFPRLLFKLVYFSLFVAPRRENLRMMWRGLRDGLTR
jgi:rhamnosyltransferase